MEKRGEGVQKTERQTEIFERGGQRDREAKPEGEREREREKERTRYPRATIANNVLSAREMGSGTTIV